MPWFPPRPIAVASPSAQALDVPCLGPRLLPEALTGPCEADNSAPWIGSAGPMAMPPSNGTAALDRPRSPAYLPAAAPEKQSLGHLAAHFDRADQTRAAATAAGNADLDRFATLPAGLSHADWSPTPERSLPRLGQDRFSSLPTSVHQAEGREYR